MKTVYLTNNLCFTVALIVLFCFSAFAQENKQSLDESGWTTIATKNDELKIDFPTGFFVNTEEQGTQVNNIFGYGNGVNMTLTVFKNNKGFKGISRGNETGSSLIEKNGMAIVSTIVKKSNYVPTLWVFSTDYSYSISVSAPDENDSTLRRFLFSVKIKDSPLFKFDEKKVSAATTTISIDSLKTSPEVDAALNRNIEKNNRKIIYEDVLGGFDFPRGTVFPNMRSAIVVKREYPKFSSDISRYQEKNNMAEAKIKVELLANGQIGNMHVFMIGNDKNFAEACVKSVEKLKFIPAEVDGKPVDSTQIISYQMTVSRLF